MVSRSFIILALSALLLLFADVNAQKPERRKLKDAAGLSREHIIENHKRRRSQLRKLIDDAKAQVDDHESGRKLMEKEEHEKVTKRIGLYEQKLEKMPEEPDDKDIKRILERETMRAERNSFREL
mmetsp:Transcript_92636/g.258929  ORF Transcript_92636/g.258929 Transcript_92636/m.258929 type:complete len:125 (+) Transcript_92636:100-474(+)